MEGEAKMRVGIYCQQGNSGAVGTLSHVQTRPFLLLCEAGLLQLLELKQPPGIQGPILTPHTCVSYLKKGIPGGGSFLGTPCHLGGL